MSEKSDVQVSRLTAAQVTGDMGTRINTSFQDVLRDLEIGGGTTPSVYDQDRVDQIIAELEKATSDVGNEANGGDLQEEHSGMRGEDDPTFYPSFAIEVQVDTLTSDDILRLFLCEDNGTQVTVDNVTNSRTVETAELLVIEKLSSGKPWQKGKARPYLQPTKNPQLCCPVPGCIGKNTSMPRHFKQCHADLCYNNWRHKVKTRKVPKRLYPVRQCPVPGCITKTKRIDIHLTGVHGIKSSLKQR